MANKMTKLLSSLLAAALTVSALPLAAFASDTVYTDTGIAAARTRKILRGRSAKAAC